MVPDTPAGLGERGLSLWESLKSTDPARNALALEAARTADRLDELDNIIQGKGVLNLMQFRVHAIEDTDADRNINVEVKFAAPLGEARQQATSLGVLLSRLGIGDAKAAPAHAPAAQSGAQQNPGGNVTPLDRMRSKMKA